MNSSTAAQYYCFHIISQHGSPYPTTATLLLEGLNLPPPVAPVGTASSSIMISRLFRGDSSAEQINATLNANGSVTFTDVWDLQSSNVYRLGCDLALLKRDDVAGELCDAGKGKSTPDCGFEVDDLARGSNMPVWPETLVSLFNTTDPRLWVSHDSADAYQGRHAARINIPDSQAVLMSVPTLADANWSKGDGRGAYTVKFAARSSPAGAMIGATFDQYAPSGRSAIAGPPPPPAKSQQTMLSAEWSVVEVEVEAVPVAAGNGTGVFSYPLHIWVQAALFPSTGAQVWVDDVSVLQATS